MSESLRAFVMFVYNTEHIKRSTPALHLISLEWLPSLSLQLGGQSASRSGPAVSSCPHDARLQLLKEPHTALLECWGFQPSPSCLCSKNVYSLSISQAPVDTDSVGLLEG